MESLPYIPGLRPAEPGPLSRFLPPLEQGTVAAWLLQRQAAGGNTGWLLDPFGFSPRVALEAARAGRRVLVTINNPVSRFLLEMAANPPSEADFKAALAELAVSKKGDERLEAHLQSLYLTPCQNCSHENQAEAFLWRKGEPAPFARIYECQECGDKGERPATAEDAERARRMAATDSLHRARTLERVAAADDEDRSSVQEAIQNYLPRPLYVLTTIINRMDSLNLSPARHRALTALVLAACDAGNTLWGYPSERPRPKALTTPAQFREHNIWMALESSLALWAETAAPVPCVPWPEEPPQSGGICIYEGRLKDLAQNLKREIPIQAVIGSIPRPNQAFWTLSALWAGWLWGRSAVDPYRAALRRRRYDFAWNATALHAAFQHLFELLALGTPFFALLPEAESAFLTSAFAALQAAGFAVRGIALRTEHDPIQLLWERGEHLERPPTAPDIEAVRTVMQEHLAARGEPDRYLTLHCAGLLTLSESHALRQHGEEFESTLRRTQAVLQSALSEGPQFTHHSSAEGLESGLWGLKNPPPDESLSDRVETALINFLQKHREGIFLEIEGELYGLFPGLLTPSKGLIYAVLNSYAVKDGASWRLRAEDATAARQADVRGMAGVVEAVGRRLHYETRREDRWLAWEEQRTAARVFYILASARVGRVLNERRYPAAPLSLVVPGGRAALIDYKEQRDPALSARMRDVRVTKFRTWRALAEVPILTRETFEEQLAADPIQQAQGQMMMF